MLQLKGIELDEEQNVSILEKVRLVDKRNFKSVELSGGMKRKLQIAIALVGNPQLVFLDEPTAGIDASNRHEIWSLIQEVKKTWFVSAYISHLQSTQTHHPKI